jgi:hypothetical protein
MKRRNISYTKRGPGRRSGNGTYERNRRMYQRLWERHFRAEHPSFYRWVMAGFPGLDKLGQEQTDEQQLTATEG